MMRDSFQKQLSTGAVNLRIAKVSKKKGRAPVCGSSVGTKVVRAARDVAVVPVVLGLWV